jgi:hypothetical protein
MKMFDRRRTRRPPRLSMVRPTLGPMAAETSSDAENAAKNRVDVMPSSRETASAMTAGK